MALDARYEALVEEHNGQRYLVRPARLSSGGERLYHEGGTYMVRTDTMRTLHVYEPEEWESKEAVWLHYMTTFLEGPEPSAPRPSDAWIAPDGRFFPCRYGEHDRLADLLSAREYANLDGADKLEKMGWVRIAGDGNLLGWSWAGGFGRQEARLSQRQRDALFDAAMVAPKGSEFRDMVLRTLELAGERL